MRQILHENRGNRKWVVAAVFGIAIGIGVGGVLGFKIGSGEWSDDYSFRKVCFLKWQFRNARGIERIELIQRVIGNGQLKEGDSKEEVAAVVGTPDNDSGSMIWMWGESGRKVRLWQEIFGNESAVFLVFSKEGKLLTRDAVKGDDPYNMEQWAEGK